MFVHVRPILNKQQMSSNDLLTSVLSTSVSYYLPRLFGECDIDYRLLIFHLLLQLILQSWCIFNYL